MLRHRRFSGVSQAHVARLTLEVIRGQRITYELDLNDSTRNMRWLAIAILILTPLFVAEVKLYGQADKIAAATESVVVYPSIAVTVNKSIVLRLPKRATRVSVTQPQIAEAVVVAPDQILLNGKAVGTTSLVVWFETELRSNRRMRRATGFPRLP